MICITASQPPSSSWSCGQRAECCRRGRGRTQAGRLRHPDGDQRAGGISARACMGALPFRSETSGSAPAIGEPQQQPTGVGAVEVAPCQRLTALGRGDTFVVGAH